MYHRFNKILEETSAEQRIPELLALKKEWDDCSLEKDSTYSKISHVLGRLYWQSGNLDEGIEFTENAAVFNSKESPRFEKKELCNNYFNLGAIYAQKGWVVESLEAFNKAITAGTPFPDKHTFVSSAYKEIASILFGQGDLEKSALASEKSFLLAKQLNDGTLMSEALIEKAQSLIELGSLREAQNALATVTGLNSDDGIYMGAVNSLAAEVAVRQKNISEAVNSYEKSFAAYRRFGFDYGCGQALTNLGFIHSEKLNDYPKAIKYYEQALNFFELPQDKAITTNSIARAKSRMGQSREAIKINQDAVSLFLQEADHPDWKYNPTAATMRQVVDKTTLLSIISGKGEILLNLFSENKDQNLLKVALSTYMLADTMVDYMRWEHSGNASKLFWRKQTRTLYENAIKTAFILGDVEKSFYFFEKSRAALLQDHMNELGASLLLTDVDQKKERELKEKVRQLQSDLENLQENDPRGSDLRNELFDAQENLSAFVLEIEKSNPAYYSYKYENRGMSISELRQNILKPKQGFLSFFVGEQAVYAFYCDETKASLKQIAIDVYKNVTEEYQNYLSSKSVQNKDFQGFIGTSNKLYQLVVAPFEINEGIKLVVSTDGPLIPFAALSQAKEKEAFLIRSHPISYTYSASYLAKTNRKKRPWYSLNSFLGMAPVDFAPALNQSSLIDSDKALQKIDKHFIFSKCLEKGNATKKAFLHNLSSYPIVQLFTHASADRSEGQNAVPKIYFADSTLSVSEINLPAHGITELLVLSACETGIGIDQEGEGVYSLARGFAEAGIPSTLTTLWNVENEAIYQITGHFYDHVTTEQPLDEALQQAQLQWLSESGKNGQLPYVWAGNVLIGNTDPIALSWSPFQIWGGCFAILLIFSIYFF